MKRTEEQKELVKVIKRLPDFIRFKRLLIFFTMLIWGGIFIFTLNCGDNFYIISLIGLPFLILYIWITYNKEIDEYLKNPEKIKNITKVQRNNTTSQKSQGNTRNAAANAAASYALGRAVQDQRKQAEAAKYGVKTKCCVVISQNGREVTYQAKCDNCGKVLGRTKTVRLNPSQKYNDSHSTMTPYCPNCKQYVCVELLLTRR